MEYCVLVMVVWVLKILKVMFMNILDCLVW